MADKHVCGNEKSFYLSFDAVTVLWGRELGGKETFFFNAQGIKEIK